MQSTFTSIVMAALLASTAPAFAQEATAEGEAATDDTAPADLSLGEPVVEDQIGQPYIRETFEDWALRCVRTPEGQEDPCQLYQLLFDQEGNAVAEISMFPLPNGGQAAAGATIVAPLETLLTEQLIITVDNGAARRYPFTFCNTAGCVSRVGFTQAEVDGFKRGSAATMRMVPAAAPDQEVVLDISLTGFTAGIESQR